MPSPITGSVLFENQSELENDTGTALPSLPLGSSAVVYCEGQFNEQDGKTANGLVRHSEKYQILSIIDSRLAGLDAGTVLDGEPNGIPVVAGLAEAIALAGHVPDYLICGVAPADGLLSAAQRVVLLDGIARGMHVINGLHEFLNDDPEFVAASLIAGVTITDVRRPKAKKDLHLFSGRIFDVTCPRIAVLGTDGAIGKRTTATLLVQALNERGIKAVMVGTGQTTLIQGGKYGVALDALVPQFCSGEVENQVVAAFEGEHPDVIVVEGQGALSHPAYLTSAHILRGSRPAGVIVQHAPRREMLGDFPMMPMPTVASEIALIEAFADTTVIGVTINHEQMTDDDVSGSIERLEDELGLPVTDALTRPLDRLVDMVVEAFPEIGAKLRRSRVVTLPRLDIDLDAIAANARVLVDRLSPKGIRVMGVGKATLASPQVAAAMRAGGVESLGDSRVENLARLRAAEPDAHLTLIRSPMLSQVDEVVRLADASLNTEPVVLERLSAAALRIGRVHDVVLMVELGDLREGVGAADVVELAGIVGRLRGLRLTGLGTNLACQSGIVPDASKMAELSRLVIEVEAAGGAPLTVVSGGNSANLAWALSAQPVGRVNELRLGESILLGTEPLHRQPIAGLRTDAFTLTAEVIEVQDKPAQAWGEVAEAAFGTPPPRAASGFVRQAILAIGRQDTDPDGLTLPPGIRLLGMSSDHLVLDVGDRPTAVGDELTMGVGYGALLRAMTSPFVTKREQARVSPVSG